MVALEVAELAALRRVGRGDDRRPSRLNWLPWQTESWWCDCAGRERSGADCGPGRAEEVCATAQAVPSSIAVLIAVSLAVGLVGANTQHVAPMVLGATAMTLEADLVAWCVGGSNPIVPMRTRLMGDAV